MTSIKNWKKNGSGKGWYGWRHNNGTSFVTIIKYQTFTENGWSVSIITKSQGQNLGFFPKKTSAILEAKKYMKNHPNG